MKGTVTLLFAMAMIGFAPWSLAQSEPPPAMQSPPPSDSVPAPDPAVGRADATDVVAANTRVAALVPAGMSTRDACIGFESLTDCAATLHAAQNLNVPFTELKQRVVGGVSLAATIHALLPRVDSRKEARRAEEQAGEDLRSTG
jgi:hypothetical protein